MLGKLKEVNAILNFGLNQAHDQKMSALYIAACNGHAAVIEAILTKRSVLPSDALKGYSPLKVAEIKGHVAVVEALKKIRVEPRSKPANVFLPFHCMTNNNNEDLTPIHSNIMPSPEEKAISAIITRLKSKGYSFFSVKGSDKAKEIIAAFSKIPLEDHKNILTGKSYEIIELHKALASHRNYFRRWIQGEVKINNTTGIINSCGAADSYKNLRAEIEKANKPLNPQL